MAHWRLKIQKQFADEIVKGNKLFEIRKEDDKAFQKGDTVEFGVGATEYYVQGAPFFQTQERHDIHNRNYKITYVLHGWGIQEGYCAFGIKEMETAPSLNNIIREEFGLPPIGQTADRGPELTLAEKLKETKVINEALTMQALRQIKRDCQTLDGCHGCKFEGTQCKIGSEPIDWELDEKE